MSTQVDIALVLIAIAAIAYGVISRGRPGAKPGAARILFPFTGPGLPRPALDAAVRLAGAEDAVLVPAYLAEVPMTLPLTCPLPNEAETALPILEAMEQVAARSGVFAEPRIERGRTRRHALETLLANEPHDRIVAPAATNGSDGFDPADVAWLLEHSDGEVVVFRAA